MTYELLLSTVQGASHIKHDIPCEDSGLINNGETRKIFITADGHGDSNCPRSRFGADTICRVAAEKLDSFVGSIADEQWTQQLFEPKRAEQLIRQLIRSIVAAWTKAVNEDYEERPLTEAERAGCSKYIERYDRGERIEHIYGTTLLAGVLTEEYLLLLHQGDGHLVLFDSQGAVSEPVAWDDRCFANVCTSMCDTDVISSMRYQVVDLREAPIAACLLGSDGIDDSFFSSEQMYAYYRELLVYAAQNGVEALQAHLDEMLPELSRTGSGDDITISAVIQPELIVTLTERFERDSQIDTAKSQVTAIRDRLASMEGGKLDFLKKRWETAAQEVQRSKKTAEDAEDAAEKAQKEYEEYLARYNELKEALAVEEEKLSALQASEA